MAGCSAQCWFFSRRFQLSKKVIIFVFHTFFCQPIRVLSKAQRLQDIQEKIVIVQCSKLAISIQKFIWLELKLHLAQFLK